MNFMEESNNQGFCGEDQNQNQNQNQNQILLSDSTAGGKLPFFSSCSTSSTSSSSSSQLRKSLTPLNFHHHFHPHHRHQPPENNWLESPQPLAAEINSVRGQRSGLSKLDLMEDDAATASASADDGNDGRQGGDTCSERLGLGVGGGGGSGSGVVVEREHMFDKVVTPSDVGKLNRLVIPKQHAEKYFPLDSSTNEKGLLLNFEDRNGKPWRFRYSYWNSSQSYVMTKGWSRFVKEKKLDAGDIVSFQRGVGELGKDRLFIDWRRRPDAPELPPSVPSLSHLPPPHYFSFQRSSNPWTPLFLHPAAPSPTPQRDHMHLPHLSAHNYPSSHSNTSYNNYNFNYNSYGYSSGVGPYSTATPNSLQVNSPGSSSVIYLRSTTAPQQVQMQDEGGGGGGGVEPMVFESVPVVHGKAAAKRLRLFGVNMDCPISESDECDILSSTTIPLATMTIPPHLSTSPHQLRLYNGSPLPLHLRPLPALQPDLHRQPNPSNSKSFDLDI